MRYGTSLCILLLHLLLLPCGGADRPGGDFGIGVIVGEPTGVSVKLWRTTDTAIDGAVAWSFRGSDRLHLHVDYLVHKFRLVTDGNVDFPLYYGLGALVVIGGSDQFGLRIPIGLTYEARENPLEFFIELVPVLALAPDSKLEFNGGLGLRLYLR